MWEGSIFQIHKSIIILIQQKVWIKIIIVSIPFMNWISFSCWIFFSRLSYKIRLTNSWKECCEPSFRPDRPEIWSTRWTYPYSPFYVISSDLAVSLPLQRKVPNQLGSPYVFLATLPLVSKCPAPKKGDRPRYNEFGDWPKNPANHERRYISGYSVSHLYLS